MGGDFYIHIISHMYCTSFWTMLTLGLKAKTDFEQFTKKSEQQNNNCVVKLNNFKSFVILTKFCNFD